MGCLVILPPTHAALAFPLQFEFLFDFPGPLGEDELRGPEGGYRGRGRGRARGSNP